MSEFTISTAEIKHVKQLLKIMHQEFNELTEEGQNMFIIEFFKVFKHDILAVKARI